jgi:tetratricopeptide (TPR) repeat protein
VVLVLAWPLVRWIVVRQSQAPVSWQSRAAGPPVTARDFIDLSLDHFRAGRYQECIDASQQALKLGPELAAVAYNNIGGCHGSLGHYDEEIRNELEALRIQPDFQMAKNNLAWALEQKKKK